MKRTFGFLFFLSMLLMGLAGCGSGGSSSSPPPATTTPPPVQHPQLTIRQMGVFQTVTAGDTVTLMKATLECPLTGTLCSLPALVSSIGFDSSVLVENLSIIHDGREVVGTITKNGNAYTFTTKDPWNVRNPGTLEVKGTVSASATAGQSATITLRATGGSGTVVSVTGAESIITVTQNLTSKTITIANPTLSLFTRSGYGKIGSFDITCPTDVGNCILKEVTEVLTSTTMVAGSHQVDTYVGTAWWYQQQITTVPTQTFVLNSPIPIAKGATVTVEVRGAILSGTLFFQNLVITDQTGKVLPLNLPNRDSLCGTAASSRTVLAPLAFPPC